MSSFFRLICPDPSTSLIPQPYHRARALTKLGHYFEKLDSAGFLAIVASSEMLASEMSSIAIGAFNAMWCSAYFKTYFLISQTKNGQYPER